MPLLSGRTYHISPASAPTKVLGCETKGATIGTKIALTTEDGDPSQVWRVLEKESIWSFAPMHAEHLRLDSNVEGKEAQCQLGEGPVPGADEREHCMFLLYPVEGKTDQFAIHRWKDDAAVLLDGGGTADGTHVHCVEGVEGLESWVFQEVACKEKEPHRRSPQPQPTPTRPAPYTSHPQQQQQQSQPQQAQQQQQPAQQQTQQAQPQQKQAQPAQSQSQPQSPAQSQSARSEPSPYDEAYRSPVPVSPFTCHAQVTMSFEMVGLRFAALRIRENEETFARALKSDICGALMKYQANLDNYWFGFQSTPYPRQDTVVHGAVIVPAHALERAADVTREYLLSPEAFLRCIPVYLDMVKRSQPASSIFVNHNLISVSGQRPAPITSASSEATSQAGDRGRFTPGKEMFRYNAVANKTILHAPPGGFRPCDLLLGNFLEPRKLSQDEREYNREARVQLFENELAKLEGRAPRNYLIANGAESQDPPPVVYLRRDEFDAPTSPRSGDRHRHRSGSGHHSHRSRRHEADELAEEDRRERQRRHPETVEVRRDTGDSSSRGTPKRRHHTSSMQVEPGSPAAPRSRRDSSDYRNPSLDEADQWESRERDSTPHRHHRHHSHYRHHRHRENGAADLEPSSPAPEIPTRKTAARSGDGHAVRTYTT